MQNSVPMTILLPITFLQRGITLAPFSFERKTDEVEHSWCIFSHGEFLGVQALILRFFDLNDALQRVNSVV